MDTLNISTNKSDVNQTSSKKIKCSEPPITNSVKILEFRNIYIYIYAYHSIMIMDFHGGSDGKMSAYHAGDPGSTPGFGKISWRREWQPTTVFLPGKSHGRKSLVGYSPRGPKESDTTERLSFTFTAHIIPWNI